MLFTKTLVATMVLAVSAGTLSSGIRAADKPDAAHKQTLAGNYLTAEEAYQKKQSQADRVLLVDVRTQAELLYVGHAKNIDKNIPFVKLDYKQWNDKKQSFKDTINPDFVKEMNKLFQSRKLAKDTPLILICRSGKRSAKATNLLTLHGFRNVYTVIDGFEGDKVKKGNDKGKRLVNGWKNTGLPWNYNLDKSLFVSLDD